MTLTLAAPLIAAILLGLATAILVAQRRSQAGLVGRRMPVEASLPAERPLLLYFTGAACAVCRTAQRPALDSLRADLGEQLSLQEIDVAAEPRLARAFRVMTLPTTVVLDATGAVRAVNAGFVSADRLRAQLTAAAGP